MSAPAFTAGPWLIHAEHRWVVPAEDAFKQPNDALPICQLRDPDERLTEDETLANGFLLAAAPELHRALKDLLELVYVHGLEQCGDLPMHEFEAIVDAAVQDAARALAKARGER